ncbi:hypothetical protein, partial [Pseudomonas aeruginosa]|uniref:hypothetical protein n=1 Tax=Pseudomonas aeruginosa TaxID=287 RepID=UPI002B409AEA
VKKDFFIYKHVIYCIHQLQMKKSFMKKLFLSASLLLALGFSVSAQTADEIIAKYITAIGGADKWRQIKSLKVEGQAEVQGLAIPF